jgi:Na+/H+ antiporter NhaD/arsenite permease-like protein
MEWSKLFDLVSIVLSLFCLYQFYRLKKESQKLSRLQNASDESIRKWSKRLIIMCVLIMLGTVFGAVSVFLR